MAAGKYSLQAGATHVIVLGVLVGISALLIWNARRMGQIEASATVTQVGPSRSRQRREGEGDE